jgi:hypothetical protein
MDLELAFLKDKPEEIVTEQYPPFAYLKLTLWILVAINGVIVLYSLLLTCRLLRILKFYTQKVMIQTILYITISLLFRICNYLAFEKYFYEPDAETPPWEERYWMIIILGTNAFTVLSFVFIFFQW